MEGPLKPATVEGLPSLNIFNNNNVNFIHINLKLQYNVKPHY